MTGTFSLMLHGGAGEMDYIKNEKDAAPYRDSIRAILEQGREILQQDGTALDAVETCTALLEDDPLFNAGRGSALNELGRVEMDAGIMDGRDLGAGAVAGIMNIANPVKLARLVLQKNEHVMLTGAGAMEFATEQNLKTVSDGYLITERRRKQYEKARAGKKSKENQTHGTVGAVARDRSGILAAATSTGGLVLKKQGRVGDSPIIGAGVYADNRTCAVSATGRGEDFMRTVLAKYIADLIEFKQLDASSASQEAMDYLSYRVSGRGGIIVIDKNGRCSGRFNTRTMVHGWTERGSAITVKWKSQEVKSKNHERKTGIGKAGK